MTQYIIRRILVAIPTLMLISMIIFAVLALAPGDPLAQFALNPAIPMETRQRIRESFGLDKPWYIRYVRWISSMSQGDWGFSFSTKSPVIDIVFQRIPQTLQVVGIAYLIAVIIAIPIGIISAVKQYSFFDQLATLLAFVGGSLPSFFTGLSFMLIFAINLQWFPMVFSSTIELNSAASLWQIIKQMIMPISVLVVQQTASLTRFMRSSMLDNLPLDYVRTARAKGIAERAVLLRHALANAAVPIVTVIGIGVALLIGGVVVTETVYAIPGLGSLTVDAVLNRDFPVIQGLVLFFSFSYVFINLLVDVSYVFLDPRIRH